MAGSLKSYLFLLRTFRNGLSLVRNLRQGGWLEQGPALERLVLWNGKTVRHPPNRGGLVPLVLALWQKNEYGIGEFYQPKPGDVVADIGAHIGLLTLLLLQKESRVQVLALEPSPENFACLAQNLAQFAPRRKIQPHNLAIGATFGRIRMGPLPTNRSFDARTVPATTTDPGTVGAVPLEHLFELAGAEYFSFLKMDVEGAEAEVFASLDGALLNRIERLAIEYHDNYQLGTAAMIHQQLASTHQVTVLPDPGELHGRLFAVRHDLARPGKSLPAAFKPIPMPERECATSSLQVAG